MTATLVTEFGRDPFDPTLYFGSNGVDGDIHVREVPGQLWEREAQREPIPTMRMVKHIEYAVMRDILIEN